MAVFKQSYIFSLILLLVSSSLTQICEEIYEERIRDCHLYAYEVWATRYMCTISPNIQNLTKYDDQIFSDRTIKWSENVRVEIFV